MSPAVHMYANGSLFSMHMYEKYVLHYIKPNTVVSTFDEEYSRNYKI
jgi:hypothetical protein